MDIVGVAEGVGRGNDEAAPRFHEPDGAEEEEEAAEVGREGADSVLAWCADLPRPVEEEGKDTMTAAGYEIKKT